MSNSRRLIYSENSFLHFNLLLKIWPFFVPLFSVLYTCAAVQVCGTRRAARDAMCLPRSPWPAVFYTPQARAYTFPSRRRRWKATHRIQQGWRISFYFSGGFFGFCTAQHVIVLGNANILIRAEDRIPSCPSPRFRSRPLSVNALLATKS